MPISPNRLNDSDGLVSLPLEIQDQILYFLPAKDLFTFGLTLKSKTLYLLSLDIIFRRNEQDFINIQKKLMQLWSNEQVCFDQDKSVIIAQRLLNKAKNKNLPFVQHFQCLSLYLRANGADIKVSPLLIQQLKNTLLSVSTKENIGLIYITELSYPLCSLAQINSLFSSIQGQLTNENWQKTKLILAVIARLCVRLSPEQCTHLQKKLEKLIQEIKSSGQDADSKNKINDVFIFLDQLSSVLPLNKLSYFKNIALDLFINCSIDIRQDTPAVRPEIPVIIKALVPILEEKSIHLILEKVICMNALKMVRTDTMISFLQLIKNKFSQLIYINFIENLKLSQHFRIRHQALQVLAEFISIVPPEDLLAIAYRAMAFLSSHEVRQSHYFLRSASLVLVKIIKQDLALKKQVFDQLILKIKNGSELGLFIAISELALAQLITATDIQAEEVEITDKIITLINAHARSNNIELLLGLFYLIDLSQIQIDPYILDRCDIKKNIMALQSQENIKHNFQNILANNTENSISYLKFLASYLDESTALDLKVQLITQARDVKSLYLALFGLPILSNFSSLNQRDFIDILLRNIEALVIGANLAALSYFILHIQKNFQEALISAILNYLMKKDSVEKKAIEILFSFRSIFSLPQRQIWISLILKKILELDQIVQNQHRANQQPGRRFVVDIYIIWNLELRTYLASDSIVNEKIYEDESFYLNVNFVLNHSSTHFRQSAVVCLQKIIPHMSAEQHCKLISALTPKPQDKQSKKPAREKLEVLFFTIAQSKLSLAEIQSLEVHPLHHEFLKHYQRHNHFLLTKEEVIKKIKEMPSLEMSQRQRHLCHGFDKIWQDEEDFFSNAERILDSYYLWGSKILQFFHRRHHLSEVGAIVKKIKEKKLNTPESLYAELSAIIYQNPEGHCATACHYLFEKMNIYFNESSQGLPTTIESFR